MEHRLVVARRQGPGWGGGGGSEEEQTDRGSVPIKGQHERCLWWENCPTSPLHQCSHPDCDFSIVLPDVTIGESW